MVSRFDNSSGDKNLFLIIIGHTNRHFYMAVLILLYGHLFF